MNNYKIRCPFVEAKQFTGENYWSEIREWLGGCDRGGGNNSKCVYTGQPRSGFVFVICRRHDRTAYPGDYIVKGPDGFSVYEKEIFEKNYAPIEEHAAEDA